MQSIGMPRHHNVDPPGAHQLEEMLVPRAHLPSERRDVVVRKSVDEHPPSIAHKLGTVIPLTFDA